MNFKEQIIIKLATFLKVNLLGTAYRAIGIGLPCDFQKSGERKFLQKMLLNLIGDKETYIFFDVGQNYGEYTELLLQLGCDSTIHCFEPNQNLFNVLLNKFGVNKRVKLNNKGLASKHSNMQLFTYSNDVRTGHGSIYKDVFKHIHNNSDIIEQDIQLTTLEEYCIKNSISKIDFIKIDVEGAELEVIKGAANMLDSINIIQLEFNEMNIISRVFLKDFYDLLPNHSFFRITEKGLFALGKYSSINEVFRIQNLIAIKKA